MCEVFDIVSAHKILKPKNDEGLPKEPNDDRDMEPISTASGDASTSGTQRAPVIARRT